MAKKKIAVRDIAGAYMMELAEKNDKVIVVNADLAGSAKTREFVAKYPERSFNVGIAEQNMVSFSAGLAHAGWMPYAFSTAPFISMRACEQCRTDVAYGGLNVRLMGNYAGYSSGVSGATHCGLEDCAIMGSMAGMIVMEPSDPYQIKKMLDATLDYDGPIYIRSSREEIQTVYTEDYDFQIGKAILTRPGDDGAFIASGEIVGYALEAANQIYAETGKNIRVVDMHTIKPIDVEAVISAAQTGCVIAAQDHNIVGGLGYYVSAVVAQAGIATKFKILGCPDHFVPIATPAYLYQQNEMDVAGLVKNMREMLEV